MRLADAPHLGCGTLPEKERVPMAKVWVFVQQEGGATAIEYGIIASMIFVVILGAVTLFGVRVTSMWTVVATHV